MTSASASASVSTTPTAVTARSPLPTTSLRPAEDRRDVHGRSADDPNNQFRVGATFDLAHRYDLIVVAECEESYADVTILRRFRWTCAQGFSHTAALAAEVFVKWRSEYSVARFSPRCPIPALQGTRWNWTLERASRVNLWQRGQREMRVRSEASRKGPGISATVHRPKARFP